MNTIETKIGLLQDRPIEGRGLRKCLRYDATVSSLPSLATSCSNSLKMGLVDYGSDSDSDTSPPPAVSSTAKPSVTSSTSSSLLSLPPPKSSLNLPAPSTSRSTTTSNLPAPKKKEKGPVRILLDLPAAQSEENEGPAKKKPKLALGSGSGLSGLAAMLPKPKNEVKPTTTPVSQPKPISTSTAGVGLGDLFDEGSVVEQEKKPIGMFAPPSLRGKGKGKATSTAPPPPPPAEPAVDFFGIGAHSLPFSVNESRLSVRRFPQVLSLLLPQILRPPPLDPSLQHPRSPRHHPFAILPLLQRLLQPMIPTLDSPNFPLENGSRKIKRPMNSPYNGKLHKPHKPHKKRSCRKGSIRRRLRILEGTKMLMKRKELEKLGRQDLLNYLERRRSSRRALRSKVYVSQSQSLSRGY